MSITWHKFSEEKPDSDKAIITYNDKSEILNAYSFGLLTEDCWTHWSYVNLPGEEDESKNN